MQATQHPANDPAIDADLRAALDSTVLKLLEIKVTAEAGTHYDQMLATGNAAGEALVMGAVDGLIAQTRSIERAVSASRVASARGSARARARSSGERRVLRDESASPSGSRTVGTTTSSPRAIALVMIWLDSV